MSKEFTTENIRNVALLGHAGTGKTTLNDQLLYIMDTITKPGKPEEKNTVSDFDDEEKERMISIFSTTNSGEFEGVKINVIDCPGMGDFIGQVRSVLYAADSAVVLVDSVDGIQMETEKMWRFLDEFKTPRIVMINKMDKENANFAKVLEDLSTKFKKSAAPLQIPIGKGPGFKGFIDLISMKAYTFQDDSKKFKEEEIPADLKSQAQEHRSKLIEVIAETDDRLTEKFLDGVELTDEEIKKGLSKSIIDFNSILVTCGCSIKGIGAYHILDFIKREFPNSGFREKTEGHTPGKIGEKIIRKMSSTEPFSAIVFKTKNDMYSGRLNYFKVLSGTLSHDLDLIIANKSERIKLQHIFISKAGKLVETNKLFTGDIGVVSKIEGLKTGFTFCDNKSQIQYPDMKMPQPVFALAVHAHEKKDEDKMNELFNKASEEDTTFHLQFNGETKQNVISGMGELQLNIILETLKRKNKIEVKTEMPRIAYRETVTKKSKAEYRHKKQSGGHGQFGEVWIELEPLERGKHFEFLDKIVGGSIPKNFIPGVEKGIVEGMEEGILAKYPLVDLRVILYDGKYHPVDSNELSFKLAARGALKAAVEKANPILLEPVMEVTILVDKNFMGNILSDITSRRGRVLGMEESGGDNSETQIIKANIPQSELQRYIIDLRSMTGGKATFEMKFSHYDPISGKDAEMVIQKRHKELEEQK